MKKVRFAEAKQFDEGPTAFRLEADLRPRCPDSMFSAQSLMPCCLTHAPVPIYHLWQI